VIGAIVRGARKSEMIGDAVVSAAIPRNAQAAFADNHVSEWACAYGVTPGFGITRIYQDFGEPTVE
jgi:hypothetical protein